jgi:hypothetical protein
VIAEAEEQYLEKESELEDALAQASLVEDLQAEAEEVDRAVELLREALPLARQAAKQYSPHGLEARTVRSIEVFLEERAS